MKEFNELLSIADRLLGPGGCPWDREQTLFTLQPYLLEEAHELIEAIDLQDDAKITEELGDVLYALVFIARLAPPNTMRAALETVAAKLIRRHPHVFGDQKISSTDDVISNWEEVKKSEGKKSPIDNIPPTLPALARAQKVIHKLRRANALPGPISSSLAQKLFDLVAEFDTHNLDAESELRRVTLEYEKNFKERK